MNITSSFGTRSIIGCLGIFLGLVVSSPANGDDWPRFLGHSGASTTTESNLPTTWDADTNVKWKLEMPGPGASSPVVLGDRIFLTCYTGYGTGSETDGGVKDLKRHLICVDRTEGKINWTRTVDNKSDEEEPYKSYITQHGYATNTPVTDGETVFVFFGKSGVLAYDLDGKPLWQTPIENRINKTRWGSAASPILFKDMLIVNAVEECGKLFALKKSDGSVVWEFDSKSTLAYSTPNFVQTVDGETELVLAAPEKVFGLDPNTGTEKWSAKTTLLNEVNASVMSVGDIVYIYGGFRGVGSLAIRSGGKGDVTDSHVLWATKDTSYIATPVIHDKHIYWISASGIAHCVEAESGNVIFKKRVPGVRGGRGIKFFGSMLSDGKNVYAVSRRSGTFVFAGKPSFELISQNTINGDSSEFNGSPAVSEGQLFLRSNKFLYCIAQDEQ